MKKQNIFIFAILGLIFFFHSTKIKAVELTTNGGFETGNFTGWTFNTQANGWYVWQVTAAGGGDGSTGGISTSSPFAGTRSAWTGFCCTSPVPSSDWIQQDVTLPAMQTASIHWSDKIQSNLWEFCSSTTCGSNVWRVQILNTSNTVLQTLYTYTATYQPTNHNTGWVSHSVDISAYAGQTIRIRFSGTYNSPATNNFNGPGRAEVDAVSVQSPSAIPTAANVHVSGRILDSGNSAMAKVAVTLTDSSGISRTVLSNSFGHYRFDEVAVGQTYILSVNHRKYLFPDSPRVITVEDELTNVDFRASP